MKAITPAQTPTHSAPIDLGSKSKGWLDVFEGAWDTPPTSAAAVAEVALVEEADDYVRATRTSRR